MKLIDKVIQHYDSQGLLQVDVPEFKDDDFDGVIYFKPMTVLERNKLVPELSKGNLNFVVTVIIMKAMDKNEQPLFGLEDKPMLMRKGDYKVLDRVANHILQGITDKEVGE